MIIFYTGWTWQLLFCIGIFRKVSDFLRVLETKTNQMMHLHLTFIPTYLRSNQSLQWFTSEVVLGTKLTWGYLVPTEPGWPSYGPEKFLGDMLSIRLFPVGPIVGVSRWLWFCPYHQQNSLWALVCTSVPISAGFWMWTRYQSVSQEERLVVPRRQAFTLNPWTFMSLQLKCAPQIISFESIHCIFVYAEKVFGQLQ